MSNTIHPTALVSAKAQLGSGNDIGAFVVIEDDVIIGDNNILLSGVVLKSGTRIEMIIKFMRTLLFLVCRKI